MGGLRPSRSASEARLAKPQYRRMGAPWIRTEPLRIDLARQEHYGDGSSGPPDTNWAERHPIKSDHSWTVAIEVTVFAKCGFASGRLNPKTGSPSRWICKVVELCDLAGLKSDLL